MGLYKINAQAGLTLPQQVFSSFHNKNFKAK